MMTVFQGFRLGSATEVSSGKRPHYEMVSLAVFYVPPTQAAVLRSQSGSALTSSQTACLCCRLAVS